MRRLASGFLALLLLSLGCGDGGPEGTVIIRPDQPAETRTTLQILADDHPSFFIPAGDGHLGLGFRSTLGNASLAMSSTTAFGAATLSVQGERDVVLEELGIRFDDIVLSSDGRLAKAESDGAKGLPPHALHLTNVRLLVGEPAPCTHVEWTANEDACDALVPTPVAIKWDAVYTDGVVMPAPDLQLERLNIDLGVWDDVSDTRARALRFDMEASFANVEAPLWQHQGFVIDDIELALHAYQMVPLRD